MATTLKELVLRSGAPTTLRLTIDGTACDLAPDLFEIADFEGACLDAAAGPKADYIKAETRAALGHLCVTDGHVNISGMILALPLVEQRRAVRAVLAWYNDHLAAPERELRADPTPAPGALPGGSASESPPSLISPGGPSNGSNEPASATSGEASDA